jgi:glucose dehydrogenase
MQLSIEQHCSPAAPSIDLWSCATGAAIVRPPQEKPLREKLMSKPAVHRRRLVSAALAAISLLALAGALPAAEYKLTVSRERLVNAQNEPQNWLMMNGDYGATRYSRLTQINRDNVKNLRMVWALALGGMQDVGQNGPEEEVNPLIDNGFMYTTDGWGTVYKIDVRNPGKGEFVWVCDPGVRHEGNVSRTRGIALWEDKVIANLPDGRVIAIDRDSGEIVWDKKIAVPNAAGSLRSTSRPARSCGAGTPSPSRATRAARPGRTTPTPGRPAAAACGRPARTTRRRA